MIPDSVKALIDKAKAIQAKVDECEAAGGHIYRVQGFSLIAHPECNWKNYPDERDMSKIKFSSYYCELCGNRVSVEEGRAYGNPRGQAEYNIQRDIFYTRRDLIELFGAETAFELFPEVFIKLEFFDK